MIRQSGGEDLFLAPVLALDDDYIGVNNSNEEQYELRVRINDNIGGTVYVDIEDSLGNIIQSNKEILGNTEQDPSNEGTFFLKFEGIDLSDFSDGEINIFTYREGTVADIDAFSRVNTTSIQKDGTPPTATFVVKSIEAFGNIVFSLDFDEPVTGCFKR